MKTLKIIYLTLIHAALAVAIFLYTSENYTLARIDHPVATCCNGDELTAFLTSQQGKHHERIR